MKKSRLTIKGAACYFGLVFLVSVNPCFSGVYAGAAVCSDSSDCEASPIVSDLANSAVPFAVTHPPGYDGTGGYLELRICVLPGSEEFIGPVRRAIATWNNLVATVENCDGCKVWEEAPSAQQAAHAESVLLHEFGHCPLGLEHPDRNWDAQGDGIWEASTFTRSVGVAMPPVGIDAGADFLRGTFDDVQIGAGSIPGNVHWFRSADNNPVIVDGTIVDINSYSPSIVLSLPDGHSWAANGNRRTAEALGFSNTQAVMYGLHSFGERKTSLTADDVSMVKMGMTGQDLLAGTADDYTIELVFVETCGELIDVFVTRGETMPTAFASCETGVDYSFPQNPFLARHLTLAPPPGGSFVIVLNQDLEWITEEIDVFTDEFESGSTSEWSSVVSP